MLTIKNLKKLQHKHINNNLYNLLLNIATDLLYYGYNFNYFYNNYCNNVKTTDAKKIFTTAKKQIENKI